MKLQNELQETINRFNKIADKIVPYAEQLKASGDYKNFKIRLANDCLRAVYKSSEICDWYDKYDCNDSHITTLAEKALDAVYPIK